MTDTNQPAIDTPPLVAGLPHFTDRLNRIYKTYRWIEGGRTVNHTHHTLSRRLRELGYKAGPSYLYQLSQGIKQNPSGILLLGLSVAFEVPVTYWFDGEVASSVLTEYDRRNENLEHSAERDDLG